MCWRTGIRSVETIRPSAPQIPLLTFGDRVRIEIFNQHARSSARNEVMSAQAREAASRRHTHRGQHLVAGFGAGGASFGANATVTMHLGMANAFRRASATEGDAVRELGLEQLPMSSLVCTRHDAAGGVAHRGAILVEPDAGDQVFDIAFGKTGVRAGRAGFNASETGVDTSADRVCVRGLLGMRAEQGADGDSGHKISPSVPQNGCATLAPRIGSEIREVPIEFHQFHFLESLTTKR
jgi:hypothetical protein